jgi:hypothetical protein
MPNNAAFARLGGACRNAIAAWRILLFILAYSIFSWTFLGTSCVFASTIGFPCPGCGATRALAALATGDVIGSLRLFPMLIPSLAAIYTYAALWFISGRIPIWMEKILLALAVLLIAVFAIRMFILFPGDAPMTYNYKAVLPRLFALLRE